MQLDSSELLKEREDTEVVGKLNPGLRKLPLRKGEWGHKQDLLEIGKWVIHLGGTECQGGSGWGHEFH